MQAMVLEAPGKPLVHKEMPIPQVAAGQVLVKVMACGICRTDLHVIDGELKHPKLPLIPGHEIIGIVEKTGAETSVLKEGMLVGIPWLGYTCGKCKYCLRNEENLCENALFTGYTMDGGFAGYTVAHEQYCFPLGSVFNDPAKAPLLCAGLIGYRSYSMIRDKAANIGIYGFGAAAHIITQVAIQQGKKIYAFTKDGDTDAQAFALKMGAVWAGNASATAPVILDAAIIFAPVGGLVPKALKDVDKGCTVVCGGIYMSDIPSFPYGLLWGERQVRSVANLTRKDGEEFLNLATSLEIDTDVQTYPLEEANDALDALRKGHINGAAVLVMHTWENWGSFI